MNMRSYLILIIILNFYVESFSQVTFNQKEFENTVASLGWGLGSHQDQFYGKGSAFDSLGSNLQGYFFSKYDSDGKIVYKRFYENSEILSLANFANKIVVQNDYAIIGINSQGAASNGELIYIDEETGDILDSLIISPQIPFARITNIQEVNESTIFAMTGYLSNNMSTTGLFLIEGKKVIADYTSSIPQFGQTAIGGIPVVDGFILYFVMDEWDSDERDPNSYFSNWIIKLDKEGNEVWQYFTDQGPNTEQGVFWIRDMIVDDDGSMIICNLDYIRHTDTLGTNSLRYRSYFHPQITKLDKDRNIVWKRNMGNGKYSILERTQLNRIVKSHEGDGYVTAGYLDNFDFRFDDANDETQEFKVKGMLAKVSNEGDSLWVREYTIVDYAPVDHFIQSMEKTNDGGYVMYGYTAFQDGLDVREGDNIAEAWILKVDAFGCLIPGCHLDQTTSTLDEAIDLQIKVFPNPTSDQLYIWHTGGKREYKLIDNTGACIREFERNTGQETIILNVDILNSGLYIFM